MTHQTQVDRDIPPGYCLQVSKESFDFGIVTESHNFIKYQNHAKKYGLVRNICNPELYDVTDANLEQFLNIEQKSPTWFRFRAAADGTASSVGKKIKGSTMYPTMEQVSESWEEYLSGKPFETTHTMRGHMKWGVGYEDPALVHFAVDNHLTVSQVGTIHLPLSYILKTAEGLFLDPEVTAACSYLRQDSKHDQRHLLVSPDGVVGTPDTGSYTELPLTMLGMLEIKCISPFHHMEEDDGRLSWVDDMETRQWFHPGQIPYVYMTQICLQAISGIYRLNMTESSTMWLIRWSPRGFSEFKINYGPLVKMGCIAAMLYFRLKQRLTSGTGGLPLIYNLEEHKLANLLHRCYTEVCDQMSHRYVNHSRLYPEFEVYRRCTERHRFIVN